MHRYQQAKTSRAQQTKRNSTVIIEDWVIAICLCVYFFCIAGGCLLWALVGVRSVHPYQMWVQIFGSALLVACTIVFVAVHVTMGENWAVAGETSQTRKLLTHGVFRWCRHPMYACFLWATLATLIATFNWMITLCVLPPCVTLLCIKSEERVLKEMFGSEYLEYCQHVSALGVPWCCFFQESEVGLGDSVADDDERVPILEE